VNGVGERAVAGAVLAEVEAGAPDASGRRRPVVTGRTSAVACDKVLLALGQTAELALLPQGWEMRGGRAWQGGQAMAVWFAGDCAAGEGTVTHAIGNGRRVALHALAVLGGLAEDRAAEHAPPVAPAQIRFSHFEVMPPNGDRLVAPSVRRVNFSEMNLGLSGPKEAERCFSCGHCTRCDTCLLYCPDAVIHRTDTGYRIDENYCKGCGMCVAECPRDAMEMHDKSA